MITPNTTGLDGLMRVTLILSVLLLGACSRSEPEAPAPAPEEDAANTNVIGKPLHQALDQARQVEQVIQDGVDQRERAMKAQGL